MNIRETFLKLTGRTYPHGTESDLFHFLPQDLLIDDFGNLWKQIGDKPSTMFACHLDTATSALTVVNHVIDGGIIRTDGKSILGADDKAGVTILLWMIENKIPGLYYFFMGEEVGCVGSKKLAEKHKKEPIDYIKKVISFDRRGTTSIITHQCSSRCCSESFGNSLAQKLNSVDSSFCYKTDPTGLYTDSAQFTSIYPECTNISVGYKSEHTFNEEQDINHLEKLAQAVIKIDWESLPIERDPKIIEYSDYSWGRNWNGYSRDYERDWPRATTFNEAKITENVWFEDIEFSRYVSFVTINKFTKEVSKVDLHKSRVSRETKVISDLLISLDIDFISMKWDGFTLNVHYKEGHKTVCNRNDLSEYLPELNFWHDVLEEEEDKMMWI